MTTWKPNFFSNFGLSWKCHGSLLGDGHHAKHCIGFWQLLSRSTLSLKKGDFSQNSMVRWLLVMLWYRYASSKTMYSAKWGPRMGKRRKFILYIHNILRYIQLPLQKCYRTWLDMVTAFVQNVQKNSGEYGRTIESRLKTVKQPRLKTGKSNFISSDAPRFRWLLRQLPSKSAFASRTHFVIRLPHGWWSQQHCQKCIAPNTGDQCQLHFHAAGSQRPELDDTFHLAMPLLQTDLQTGKKGTTKEEALTRREQPSKPPCHHPGANWRSQLVKRKNPRIQGESMRWSKALSLSRHISTMLEWNSNSRYR